MHSLLRFSFSFIRSDAQTRLCLEAFGAAPRIYPCSVAFAVLDVPKCTRAAISLESFPGAAYARQTKKLRWAPSLGPFVLWHSGQAVRSPALRESARSSRAFLGLPPAPR